MDPPFTTGMEVFENIFDDLIQILKKKPLEVNKYRTTSGIGRSQCFGIVKQRNGKYSGSRHNFARMDIYQELLHIARCILPADFKYDGIQLNQNYRSEPHRDSGNRGISAIVGFGDYTEGFLTIDLCDVNIKNRIIFFDGSLHIHSTTPFSGDRFSIVFHSNKQIHLAKPFYTLIANSDNCLALQEDLEGIRRIFNRFGKCIHASDGRPPVILSQKPTLRECIPFWKDVAELID